MNTDLTPFVIFFVLVIVPSLAALFHCRLSSKGVIVFVLIGLAGFILLLFGSFSTAEASGNTYDPPIAKEEKKPEVTDPAEESNPGKGNGHTDNGRNNSDPNGSGKNNQGSLDGNNGCGQEKHSGSGAQDDNNGQGCNPKPINPPSVKPPVISIDPILPVKPIKPIVGVPVTSTSVLSSSILSSSVNTLAQCPVQQITVHVTVYYVESLNVYLVVDLMTISD